MVKLFRRLFTRNRKVRHPVEQLPATTNLSVRQANAVPYQPIVYWEHLYRMDSPQLPTQAPEVVPESSPLAQRYAGTFVAGEEGSQRTITESSGSGSSGGSSVSDSSSGSGD